MPSQTRTHSRRLLRLLQGKAIHSASPRNIRTRKPAATPIHQRSADRAEEADHGVVNSDCLVRAELGEPILSAELDGHV